MNLAVLVGLELLSLYPVYDKLDIKYWVVIYNSPLRVRTTINVTKPTIVIDNTPWDMESYSPETNTIHLSPVRLNLDRNH